MRYHKITGQTSIITSMFETVVGKKEGRSIHHFKNLNHRVQCPYANITLNSTKRYRKGGFHSYCVFAIEWFARGRKPRVVFHRRCCRRQSCPLIGVIDSASRNYSQVTRNYTQLSHERQRLRLDQVASFICLFITSVTSKQLQSNN